MFRRERLIISGNVPFVRIFTLIPNMKICQNVLYAAVITNDEAEEVA